MKQNLIADKSYAFALAIIQAHLYLTKEKKEFIIARQLLKSGTSVGANVREAVGAQSRADFINKMSIAFKEALETEYWLNLLKDSKLLPNKMAEDLLIECQSICRIITKIQISTKNNDNNRESDINHR
jgi:four helix bundle protein